VAKSILVTGDFIIDHHIYEGRRHHYSDWNETGVTVKRELGGAALVDRLLAQLLPDGWTSYSAVEDPTKSTAASAQAMAHRPDEAHAFWRPLPAGNPPEKQCWRVSEAMGFGTSRLSDKGTPEPAAWTPASNLPNAPDITVVANGGAALGKPARASVEPAPDSRWIVLKIAAPVMAGSTWHRLKSVAGKLVILVSAAELRKSPVRLSEGLSWEETIQDLLHLLAPGETLAPLTQCRHLVVSFGTEGALWFDLPQQGEARGLDDHTTVRLVYDASAIEGDHAKAIEGDAFGLHSCLVAAVTRQLAIDPANPNLTPGLDGGLCAMRDLLDKGHGAATSQPDGFPAERLAAAIKARPYVYSRATFQSGDATNADWSLLKQSQRATGPAYDLARLVLLRGPIALANVPHLRVGQFVTPDRHEIETLRGLIQVVGTYAKQARAKKPLSIGIFGPPGAGKSFAVKELSSIVPRGKWLEFNLSQSSGPADLISAFHQIRDSVLEGDLPVAFFDEFDSQSYVWLKYLLAPMQDGKFQDGQLIHPLGRCVLVFAGATSWTHGSFGPAPSGRDDEDEPPHCRDFRLSKGPDFKSRLDVYLDVVGPNQRSLLLTSKPAAPGQAERFDGRWFGPDATDIHFPVRRALMIRSALKCSADQKPAVDPGVVHALLHTVKYEHGARSLEKVLRPLVAARPAPLTRSMLPPRSQLSMHVDAAEFSKLCQVPQLPGPWAGLPPDALEKMARAVHETYRELGRQAGWLKPELDKDFQDLPEFYQNSNRAAADRMATILALAGLGLKTGLASASDEERVRTHLEYSLEALAEAEHDGWMQWHFSQGWRYSQKRNDEKKLHDCLRPYRQLSQLETDKDRDAIRHYPDFAREAEMQMVL
jgi:hypothetical protein